MNHRLGSNQQLPRSRLHSERRSSTIPVEFGKPWALPESSWVDASARNRLNWQPQASARTPGVDFGTSFTIPDLIPAFGVVFLGWSVSLILLLYWLENLIGSILWNRLIRRHQAVTHLRGHYRNQLGVSSNGQAIERFASEHFAGTVIFTLGHGVFLFLFAFLILDGSPVLEDLPWVLLLAAGVAVAAFVEIQPLHRNLERRSFAWLREQARISTWPVIAMHLGVIFGGVGLALVFIALRVGVDLMRVWYRKNPSTVTGLPPPRPDGMDEAVYTLIQAAHERTLRDEEVSPPEESGRR